MKNSIRRSKVKRAADTLRLSRPKAPDNLLKARCSGGRKMEDRGGLTEGPPDLIRKRGKTGGILFKSSDV